jgi:hypothetical protein
MTHFTASPDQPPEYHSELWREAFLAPNVPAPAFIDYVSDLPDDTTPVPDGHPVIVWGLV